ncbi:MAG: Gfo/Idh/MocA family protein [Candidatus Zipacnadales bacterium]
MVRVGILGMGFIGQQHFNTWKDVQGAQVVAVADKEIARVAETAAAIGGNIGDADVLDLSKVNRYTSLEDMLGAGEIDVVDICLPTFLHAPMVTQALAAGVHVICEKPMALTVEACDEMLAAAKEHGKMLFLAHCIRFWPEYEVLAKYIRDGHLGRLVSLKLTRISPSPFWSQGGWLNDPEKSGGALLDLHIHDADFIMSVLGMPPAVYSRAGSLTPAGPKVDHVVTHYLYENMLVVAEGGWTMPPNYPFEMAFEALGEKGCLTFSTSHDPMLTFYPREGGAETPSYRATTGYLQELEYFTDCIAHDRPPQRVTAFEAREAVRLIMAERKSIESGSIVTL